MSNDNKVMPWEPHAVSVLPDTTHDIPQMAHAARQLRERERNQLVANFEAGHFDVVSTFIWHRTMTLLKKQLAKLGNEFIAELLQNYKITLADSQSRNVEKVALFTLKLSGDVSVNIEPR